jgi:hypothetical protein
METMKFAYREKLVSLLGWLVDGYWPRDDEHDGAIDTIRSPTRSYTLQRLLASGDVADIYLAGAGDSESTRDAAYLLKLSRGPEGCSLLDNERRALTKLVNAAGETTYGRYVPVLVESFTAGKARKRVNVFRSEAGLYTLAQVHEQHPALDGRHIAWIFKRLLTVLGFSHRQETTHGAVLPCHVLIHSAGHGLQLVGWGGSVRNGRRIQTLSRQYRHWYPREVPARQCASPATDIFLAARCMVYLAGGDPERNWLPDTVPAPMHSFIRACLLESPRMRPQDAWKLHAEFDELLLRVYGAPKFHELIMN